MYLSCVFWTCLAIMAFTFAHRAVIDHFVYSDSIMSVLFLQNLFLMARILQERRQSLIVFIREMAINQRKKLYTERRISS